MDTAFSWEGEGACEKAGDEGRYRLIARQGVCDGRSRSRRLLTLRKKGVILFLWSPAGNRRNSVPRERRCSSRSAAEESKEVFGDL